MSSKEILWNIVNSLLAGAISFVSAVIATKGTINTAVISVSVFTALMVALVKFAEYWKKEEKEYLDEFSRNNKIFTFI